MRCGISRSTNRSSSGISRDRLPTVQTTPPAALRQQRVLHPSSILWPLLDPAVAGVYNHCLASEPLGQFGLGMGVGHTPVGYRSLRSPNGCKGMAVARSGHFNSPF